MMFPSAQPPRAEPPCAGGADGAHRLSEGSDGWGTGVVEAHLVVREEVKRREGEGAEVEPEFNFDRLGESLHNPRVRVLLLEPAQVDPSRV